MRSDLAVFDVLQMALQASALKQQVYANNIANVDTPGYKRQDVEFESLLQSALNDTSPPAPTAVLGETTIPLSVNSTDWTNVAHIQPQIVTTSSTSVDNSGNNVDIDAEMSQLADNQIRYNALIQDVKLRLQRMQSAISGG